MDDMGAGREAAAPWLSTAAARGGGPVSWQRVPARAGLPRPRWLRGITAAGTPGGAPVWPWGARPGGGAGVGAGDPGLRQLPAALSPSPAGLREGRSTGRARGGGGKSVSARPPPPPAETSLSGGAARPGPPRPAPRNLPGDVRQPCPRRRRDQAGGESRGRARAPGSSWVPAWVLPPPGLPILLGWLSRGTLTEGFGKVSWVIMPVKSSVQPYYFTARETEMQTFCPKATPWVSKNHGRASENRRRAAPQTQGQTGPESGGSRVDERVQRLGEAWVPAAGAAPGGEQLGPPKASGLTKLMRRCLSFFSGGVYSLFNLCREREQDKDHSPSQPGASMDPRAS